MRPLVDALYAYINPKKQTDWERYLAPIRFAFNARVHPTTGVSPFFMVTGLRPRAPADVISGRRMESLRDDDSLPFSTALANLYREVRDRLVLSAAKRKSVYDAKHLDVTFDPDNTVMVYADEAFRKGESTKFLSRWIGPFRVISEVTGVTYQLEHLRTGRTIIAHVNRIRKVNAAVRDEMAAVAVPTFEQPASVDLALDPGVPAPEPTIPTPTASAEDGRPGYEMERILSMKVGADKGTWYLVKFRGYDDPEWTRDVDIDGRDMVKEIRRQFPKTITTRSRRQVRSSDKRDNAIANAVEPNNADVVATTRRSPRLHLAVLQVVWAPAL